MLKKHNKLIVFLVLAAFMFTIVGSASAATFSDVTGTTTEGAAIYKLNSLGIIDGYPDGTFGPEKTITRAEFAKIAVYMAGLQAVANGMQGTPSSFKDVSSDFWGNGWINVAAAQGFVKGYPDGTFKPQAQITQAEVITVQLRILGYNDNLPGNWPADYIGKAANLGILDDITFVANKAATRGEVAMIGSAVLDEDVVEYKASDNIFDSKGETLLKDKFDDASTIEDAVVYGVDLTDGEIAFNLGWYYEDDKGNDVWTTDKYTLAENCVLAGAASWAQAKERMIDFVLNDDEEITYIKVLDYKVITMDADEVEITKVGDYKDASGAVTAEIASQISIDGKSYDVDNNVQLLGATASQFKDTTMPGNVTANLNKDFETILNGLVPAAAVDYIKFVLNDDGDIQLIKPEAYFTGAVGDVDKMGIVDTISLSNAKITFKNGGSLDLDEDDTENYYILYNGLPGTIEDIKANDIVWNWTANKPYAVEEFVLVYSADKYCVTGILEEYEVGKNLPTAAGALKNVTVDGKTYKVALGGTYLYSDDEGDSFVQETDPFELDNIVGEEVTIWTSPVANKVFGISSGTTSDSGKIYGVVNDNAVNTMINGKVTPSLEILKADGTLATYGPDEDSEYWTGAAWADLTTAVITATFTRGTMVEVSLNSDGYIKQIKDDANIKNALPIAAGTALTGEDDTDVVTIAGNSYDAANAIIFDASDPTDDFELASLADFLDKIDDKNETFTTATFAIVKDGVLKYLVLKDAALTTTQTKLAMLAKIGRDVDGDYALLLNTDGTTTKYTVKDKGNTTFAKNNVISYEIAGGDLKNTDFAGYNMAGAVIFTIDKVNNNILTLDDPADLLDGNYYVDADTLYWDSTDDDPKAIDKGDIAAGDKIRIYREDKSGAIDAIQVVD
jgi:hypothetical protein